MPGGAFRIYINILGVFPHSRIASFLGIFKSWIFDLSISHQKELKESQPLWLAVSQVWNG